MQQLPIVYNEVYNVSFCGIENLHVFDSKKFRKVIAALEEKKLITKRQVQQLLEGWCYMYLTVSNLICLTSYRCCAHCNAEVALVAAYKMAGPYDSV